MDVTKEAYQVLKAAIELMEREEDKAEFEPIVRIYNDASGMINDNEANEALLKGWIVAEANRAVYCVWRRGNLNEEVEKAYRALPEIDEATKDYNDYLEADKKAAEEIEAKRAEYMNGRRAHDIFNAVLKGVSKEEAEAKYKEYQEQLAKAIGQ